MKSNEPLVVAFEGLVDLTTVMNASRGISTQSDGSEFGDCEGSEHVFMSFAFVELMSESVMMQSAFGSFG